MTSKVPTISVIIPVYHQWSLLSKCLEALEKQTLSQNEYEVLVINNDPTDPCPLKENFSGIIFLEEIKPGSYAARNAGIQHARGEILAFTDADCVPDTDWLKMGLSFLMSNPNYSRIGGKIELFSDNSCPSWVEVYERIFAFRQDSAIRRHGSAVTANMMTWRHVFKRVGLFDEKMFSGGDHAWGKLAQQCGESIAYCPQAIVAHPARASLHALLRKHRRIVVGKIGAESGSWLATREIVRSLLPPMLAFRELRKQQKNPLIDCLKACCVLNLIRMYRIIVILAYKMRLIKRTRV